MFKTCFYIVIIFVLVRCKVDPKINPILPSDDLKEIIPPNWPQPKYTFSTNTITEDKFILGRALFYDPILSKDNTISCGSCHQQFVAFANADHALSHGINDLLGKRNAPGLFNLVWHSSFMHDGGINHIENQPIAPITNTVEMGDDINPILEKLNASSKYKNLFNKAFGSEVADTKKLQLAMVQFMGLMYSYNSKYDRFKRQENNTSFNDSETRGYSLFLQKCAVCHTEPLMSSFEFRNNGLPVDPFLKDKGRGELNTAEPGDDYLFKIPSLRNVALTGPYMHDGRFTTLEQCINHYTAAFTNTINLAPELPRQGMTLSAQDKADLVSFLNTLTDYRFISDKRFADPNFK